MRMGEPELARAAWELFITYVPKEPYVYVNLSILTADTEPEQSGRYLDRARRLYGRNLHMVDRVTETFHRLYLAEDEAGND
jgi:hypothetical protein